MAALRRPTVSVWVAIQLAGAAPNALAELLEAGAALVRAQQDALAGKPEAARRVALNRVVTTGGSMACKGSAAAPHPALA